MLPEEEDAIISNTASDFDLDEHDENAVSDSVIINECVKNLVELSNLHIAQEGRVRKACNDNKEVGLFYLFLQNNI